MARSTTSTGDPIQALHYAMRQVASLGASDLHLKAGAPPYVRLNGDLQTIPGMYALSNEEMEKVARELARRAPNRLHEFEHQGETDLAYEMPGCARFRINMFRQRGDISIALRIIPDHVPSLEDLNLPPVLESMAMNQRGLILLTGATGSGKTTSLAAMIDHINNNSSRHIVTIEDPIEIVHRDNKSIINQREVGMDTGSFRAALRRALRQDPDVILIGEMRDEETVRTAISAAETGHLVLSTLHTIDVMESIYRILDFFPPALERQARNMLAGTLRGIISQRLVRTRDGRSRVPAVEVLVGTSRVADCILRPEETDAIHSAITEGGYYGMQSFDQALLQLVGDGAVSVEEAMQHASSKQNFALLLEANSIQIDRGLRKHASGSFGSADEGAHEVPQGVRPSVRPAAAPPPSHPMPAASLPASINPAAPHPGHAHPAEPRQPRPPGMASPPIRGTNPFPGRGAA